MNSNSESEHDRFWQLADLACAGSLTNDHVVELQTLLEGNRDLQQLYVDHMRLRLDVLCLVRAEAACSKAFDHIESLDRIVREEHNGVSPSTFGFLADTFHRWGDVIRRPTATFMAIAVLLMVAIALPFALNQFSPNPELSDAKAPFETSEDDKTLVVGRVDDESVIIARVIQQVDCEWIGENGDTVQLESIQENQRLRLQTGQAKIVFSSGAEVILQGPADFVCISPIRAHLYAGRLTADVPEQAYGFTIDSHSVTAVDLGTQFGMRVQTNGISELHVFKGEVETHVLGQDGDIEKTNRFVTGQASRFYADRSLNNYEIAIARKDEFVRQLSLRNDPIFSSVRCTSGKEYLIKKNGLKVGEEIYIDRSRVWTELGSGVPNLLLGADVIQGADEDKDDSAFEIEVEVAQACTLFVLYHFDVRTPEWLHKDFQPLDVYVSRGVEPDDKYFKKEKYAGGQLSYHVWSRIVQPGTYRFGPNADLKQTLYVIAAQPLYVDN